MRPLIALLALVLSGCVTPQERAMRFCADIGIPKEDPRFAECALRWHEARSRAPAYNWQQGMNQSLMLMEAGQPRTLGGPVATCHRIGTMVQCY